MNVNEDKNSVPSNENSNPDKLPTDIAPEVFTPESVKVLAADVVLTHWLANADNAVADILVLYSPITKSPNAESPVTVVLVAVAEDTVG